MKKLSYTLVFLLLFTSLAFGKSLHWKAPTTGGKVEGYLVYYSNQSASWSLDVGNVLEFPLEKLNLSPGESYTLYVRAYNTAGQGKTSNEVTYTPEAYIPIDNPKAITITIPGPITINITVEQ